MFHRAIAVAIIATLTSVASGLAQTSSGSSKQTKKPTQTNPPPAQTDGGPTIELRNGVWWIVPKKPKPETPAQSGRGGLLTPAGGVMGATKAAAGGLDAQFSILRLADRFAAAPLLVRSNGIGIEFGGNAPRAQAHPAAPDMQMVQAVQGARANTYLIQFKPNTTQAQRDDLLRRYDLQKLKEIPSLNIYVVSRRSIPANEPPPKNVAELYNPPIIRQLRGESIVANASVDSASAPRTIPRASPTKSQDDQGVIHQWTWKTTSPAPSGNLNSISASAQPEIVDGNWGLKAIRMPPVWTIMKNFRAANPNAPRPKLAIIDSVFSKHEDLAINILPTRQAEGAASTTGTTSSDTQKCQAAHGNHVASIAGAVQGNGIGVDGVIPDAIIDAVTVTDSSFDSSKFEGQTGDLLDVRTHFFSDLLIQLTQYIGAERAAKSNLRVISISMGLNAGQMVSPDFDIDKVKAALGDMIRSQAQMFIDLVRQNEDSILIVVAAGNDSNRTPMPLEAQWASSLAWMVRGKLNNWLKRPKNILVVEAVDQNDQRAVFSNINGHISAPGVDILGARAGETNEYGVCSGTSQAAPYAAAVATLLFELYPNKKPAEIIDVLIKTGAPTPDGKVVAPRLDALEAVLRIAQQPDGRNDSLIRLTDLNGDGKVDIADMKEFARQLALINKNRLDGTPIAEDLNGDNAKDGNECNWPVIDFNGSGSGSLAQSDARIVLGQKRDDLAVMQLAWTDRSKDSATAIKETGLDVAIQAADLSNVRISPQACQ